VTDENGNTYTDTFEMLVRDIDKGVITEVDPMGALMEEAGVIKIREDRRGGCEVDEGE
jgi:hypothetical protein